MKKLVIMLVAALLVTLVFSTIGCGGGGGEATPTPTNTPAATQSPNATQTPGNTATPTATNLASPDELTRFIPLSVPSGWSIYHSAEGEIAKDPMSGHDCTHAGVSWSTPNLDDIVSLNIYDYGAYLSGSSDDPKWSGSQDTTVGGYPAWKIVDTGQPPHAELTAVMQNRFVVRIGCGSESNLNQLSALIDYAGIAALE